MNEMLFLEIQFKIERVKMELDRVSTIAEWSKLSTFREISVFLEFANF